MIILYKIREYFFYSFLALVGAWLIFALGLMFYSVYLEFSGNQEKLQQMSNEFNWKFDGTFKNSPGNISYVVRPNATSALVKNLNAREL